MKHWVLVAVTLKEEEVARYLTNLEHKDDALHADYHVFYELFGECCLDLGIGTLKDLMQNYLLCNLSLFRG